jgi:Flp pilus assembly protein TadD
MSRRIVPERDTAIACYNEGCMLANREQFDEAIKKFDEALGIDPKMINALHNKALALQRLGNLRDANLVYNELMKLTPNNPRVLNEVGLLRSYLDDLEGALLAFNQLIKINKASPNVYSNKGVILLKQGKTKDAESVLLEILETHPDYDTARYNLATVYAVQQNFERLNVELNKLANKIDRIDLMNKIANDADFDRIRQSEEFQKILKELFDPTLQE